MGGDFLDLVHLQCFKTVAAYQNMVKAGESLHIGQPAVSKIIKNLEEELGLPLFDRRGKNISLNQNGKILLRYADTALAAIENARLELEDLRKTTETGTVRILMKVLAFYLPDIVAKFKSKYPEINLEIMQHGDCDAWDICIDASLEKLSTPDYYNLLEEEIYLVLPKGHPLAASEEVNLEEFANDKFIGMFDESSVNNITKFYCNKAGFEPELIIKSETNTMFREISSLGLGVAFIPKFVYEGIKSDCIVKKSIGRPACARYVNVSLKKDKYHTNAVLLLKKFLIAYFQDNEIFKNK